MVVLINSLMNLNIRTVNNERTLLELLRNLKILSLIILNLMIDIIHGRNSNNN